MINLTFNLGGKMTSFQTFVAHLIIAVAIIAAAIVLAVLHIIDGATAVGMISSIAFVSIGAVITTTGTNTGTAATTPTQASVSAAVASALAPPVLSPTPVVSTSQNGSQVV